mgnify:CR=1 FL=1
MSSVVRCDVDQRFDAGIRTSRFASGPKPEESVQCLTTTRTESWWQTAAGSGAPGLYTLMGTSGQPDAADALDCQRRLDGACHRLPVAHAAANTGGRLECEYEEADGNKGRQ